MNQKLLFFKLLEDIAYYSMNLINSFQHSMDSKNYVSELFVRMRIILMTFLLDVQQPISERYQ